jgi:hypothetical protein
MITESDQLAKALDHAAKVYPELVDERAELLRCLIERGIQSLEAEYDEAIEARRNAIRGVAGSLSGVWPENYLDELRSEWPA